MAISSVQVYVNGTWHTCTYNSTSAKYEATITAPTVTSWNQTNNVYALEVKATNTAGTFTTVTTSDATVGNALKLRVKETLKPTIAITSPGAGATVINNKQAIVFQLRDETNGSGVALSTLSLQIDSLTAVGSTSAGMVCTAVTGGYNCTYTPQSALGDGSHTIKINVSDNDGNVATQISQSFKIDTTPPVLNVTAPTNNFLTNNASLTIQGNTNDAISSPVVVTVTLNGVDTGTVTVASDGTFTKAITLASGSNTIIVKATDSASKSSTVTITGTLDTSVPKITAVTVSPNPANTGQSMIISVTVTG